MIRYPKTPRLPDWHPEDPSGIRGATAVVEEKVDGANAAVSFEGGELVLQSRGHVLSGGAGEAQFSMFKAWAAENRAPLRSVLGGRYVAFGEWCYAKHRSFYDSLPDFFLEFDILDRESGEFLSTGRRRALLVGGPITSVAVLHEGPLRRVSNFSQFVGPSRYKSGRWRERFDEAMASGLGRHYAEAETDLTGLMEGVYVKAETDGRVAARAKLVRDGFDKVRPDDSRWMRRPIFPNLRA